MRRPTFLAMGVLWLAVVIAVSALTWTVIDAAGRDLLTSAGAGSLPDEVTSVSGGPTATPSPRERGRDRGDEPRTSPAPSASSSRTPSPTGPSATADPSPSAEPTPTRPADSPEEPPTQPQLRSWQGAAGSVAVGCVGSRISLQSAYPTDGWRIEVKKRGPDEVDIELESGGDDERRTRVRAECGEGGPQFRVDSDD